MSFFLFLLRDVYHLFLTRNVYHLFLTRNVYYLFLTRNVYYWFLTRIVYYLFLTRNVYYLFFYKEHFLFAINTRLCIIVNNKGRLLLIMIAPNSIGRLLFVINMGTSFIYYLQIDLIHLLSTRSLLFYTNKI